MKLDLTVFNSVVQQTGAFFKKYAPEILTGVGIAAGIAGTVMACKATVQAKPVLENHQERLNSLKQYKDSNDGYSDDSYKKDRIAIYASTTGEIVKLYSPAVLLGAVSIVSILSSTKILKGRTAAATAAYVSLSSAFRKYRDRVIDKFGEKVDEELRFDTETRTIERMCIDEETGKKKKVKKEETIYKDTGESDTCFFYDPSNGYRPELIENYMLKLEQRESYANDILRARGRFGVYENEILELIDMPKIKAGQFLGWRYDRDNPTGDNYIDFRLKKVKRSTLDKNGCEVINDWILIDLNVDGNIIDYTPETMSEAQRLAVVGA